MRRHDSDLFEDPTRRFLLFAEGEGDGAGGGDGEGEGGEGEGDKAGEGGNGALDGDWRASITDPEGQKFAESSTDVGHLVGRALEMRKQLSTAIQIPGEDASDDDRGAYRKALGVPEAATDYVFAMPEGKEATDVDTAFQVAAGEVFHGLDISAAQAEGLTEWWNGISTKATEEIAAADKTFADESEAALKVKWPGAEFDKNSAFADLAARKMFGDNLDAVRGIETKAGRFVLDHAEFREALAGIGREMEEGGLGSVMTDGDRDSAQEKIEDFEKRIDKAQAEGDGEKANTLYQEQQLLYQRLTGGASIVGAEGRTV